MGERAWGSQDRSPIVGRQSSAKSNTEAGGEWTRTPGTTAVASQKILTAKDAKKVRKGRKNISSGMVRGVDWQCTGAPHDFLICFIVCNAGCGGDICSKRRERRVGMPLVRISLQAGKP